MPSVKVSPARLAAFEILQKITLEKAFSAVLLPAYEKNLKLEDRALCHELVLGVLRNQTFLDKLIELFSAKKTSKLDLAVLLALRLGLYQLRFLNRVPARAAVNESVNLVHFARLRSAVGFVNAILRKVEREPISDPLANIKNLLERLSIETSHPTWLLEKWQKDFGLEQTTQLAHANNAAPPTSFRLTDFADEQVLNELRAVGAQLIKSKWVPNAWLIEGASAKLRQLMTDGKVYLQDEASQLIAHQVNARANNSFLDVCAAPGSKTTLVAFLKQAQTLKSTVQNSTENPNIDLSIAGDYSFARTKILRETVATFAHDKVKIVQYDATRSLPFAESSFDCVLVDAPCSGTGTIRHNPEIRWHLHPLDLANLAQKQFKILTNAAKMTKAGGRLIYSTCSLEPEENEAVIESFLANNKSFEKTELCLSSKFLTEQGFARTFPHRDAIDGFFITVLKRKQKD